jgi:hypothetical protein
LARIFVLDAVIAVVTHPVTVCIGILIRIIRERVIIICNSVTVSVWRGVVYYWRGGRVIVIVRASG